MNQRYFTWLHDLTTKGYDKGIVIPRELSREVTSLFKANVKPERAVDIIIGMAHFKGLKINKDK